MKTAIRVARTYALLASILWLLGSLDAMCQCGGIWGAVSFIGAMVFYILIFPGLQTIGLLIPYAVNESSLATFIRELVSLVATGAILFVVALVLIKAVANVRKPAKA